MGNTMATWIIVSSGERRRMLYVDGRTGQLHRVFEEADEVWRRLDVGELLDELMLDPARDRLVLVAGLDELDKLEDTLTDGTRELVGLRVDRDLWKIADPLVVHVVREMLTNPTAKRTLPVNPWVVSGLHASAHGSMLG